jgi:hypothetical protein
MNGECWPAISS